MKLGDAKPGMHVFYIPGHAPTNPTYWEYGTITKVNSTNVFVKFDPKAVVGIACSPSDLRVVRFSPRILDDKDEDLFVSLTP